MKYPGGIYQIVNNENGKMYIGSAVNLNNRRKCHICMLKKGNHHCNYLQHAWDRSGEKGFSFCVLEYVKEERQLIKREQ